MKLLLCLLPGLGDALAASPVTRGAINAGWDVDVLTMLRPVAEYARALDGVRRVFEAPLLHDFHSGVMEVVSLRSHRYDMVAVPFPATRWQYLAVAIASGSKIVAVHDYGHLAQSLAALRKASVVQLHGGHRYWENVRLAQSMGLHSETQPEYLVPATWRRPTIPGILGISTGSMRYKGNETRRWPIGSFAEVIVQQIRGGRRVRVFLGPQEREDRDLLASLCGGARPEFVEHPLDAAARSVAECEVFLGNDAGLAHVAAALGCKTLVVFGMTDPVRALPIGNAVALRPSACPPCNDEGLKRFVCVKNLNYRCLIRDVSSTMVSDAVDNAFAHSLPYQRGSPSGPFRLYGHTRLVNPA